MSETSFALRAPDAAWAPEDEVRRRRPPRSLVGAAAVAVVATGAFFAVGSGSSAVTPVSSALPVSKVAPVPQTVPAPGHVPPPAAEPVGRNPFKVLYVEPVAAPAAPAAGTATGATSGTTPAGAGLAVAPAAAGQPAAQPAGSTPVAQPQQPPKYLSVQSVDSAANQVTFTLVDRTVTDPKKATTTVVVKPGEVFATYFKLLGYGTVLDANNQPRSCTDLQYGDNRIKLCVGESYQVG